MFASIEPYFECLECKENERLKTMLQGRMSAILDSLYEKDSLDLYRFETHLDEICFLLCIPLRKGDLQIERKNESVKNLSEVIYAIA